MTSVTSPATASRGLKASPLRRISEIVLVVGTMAATAAASSESVWIVRLGVATAITTALVACAFAWRELNTARHAHAQAMLEATRKHGAALTEERTRNAESLYESTGVIYGINATQQFLDENRRFGSISPLRTRPG